ncbi:MAG: ATP-binding protein [Prosthecobacter sp.]|nr:ATP-binding protein [Prosthecobacter sp.]
MAVILESFRLKNFKAVRDTGLLKFGGFTVLVGGNGSGKSSLLEGLEVFRSLGTLDVDTIFNQPRWRGFHHVWNKAVPHELDQKKNGSHLYSNPMTFDATVTRPGPGVMVAPKNAKNIDPRQRYITEISQTADGVVTVANELAYLPVEMELQRQANGKIIEKSTPKLFGYLKDVDPGYSILSTGLIGRPFEGWQFLNLNAPIMGQPTPLLGGRTNIYLQSDGSNLAEFIRKLSPAGLERLLAALQQVVGYAGGIDVGEFSSVDRTVYLKIKEGGFDVPGWMMSGGTVRLVAILACLFQDIPPPLLVIEEIENGLDPRTVGFLVSQLREAVESGRTQIIATTHSPHFLSQAALEHLLLCQRMKNGEPRFWRPSDSEELRKWAEDFHPGELFATGRIQKEMTKALGDA